MNARLSAFALCAILIAGMGVSPAFGQVIEPVTVATDKASYESGETITITGKVRQIISGMPVTLQIYAPNGNLAAIAQPEVREDKTFGVELFAGGNTWISEGTYTVKVQYGSDFRTAETTFEFDGSGIIINGGMPDDTVFDVSGIGVGYTITGGSLLSIDPSVESSSLIIGIDATSDGTLTIKLPREVIDARLGDDGCSGGDEEFFVLIDGEEMEFDEVVMENSRDLAIDFPAGSEEIEIIGTCVIPEFGTVAVLVLAVAIVSIIAVSARSGLGILPRY